MNGIKQILAINLKRIRKDKGMSQEDLAHIVGVDIQSIAAVEQGRTWPTIKNIEAIASALRVKESDLFLDIENKPKPSPFEIISIISEALEQRINNMELPAELIRLWSNAPEHNRRFMLTQLKALNEKKKLSKKG